MRHLLCTSHLGRLAMGQCPTAPGSENFYFSHCMHARIWPCMNKKEDGKKRSQACHGLSATSMGRSRFVDPGMQQDSAVGNHCFRAAASRPADKSSTVHGQGPTRAARRAHSHQWLSVQFHAMRAIRPRPLLITYKHAAASRPD